MPTPKEEFEGAVREVLGASEEHLARIVRKVINEGQKVRGVIPADLEKMTADAVLGAVSEITREGGLLATIKKELTDEIDKGFADIYQPMSERIAALEKAMAKPADTLAGGAETTAGGQAQDTIVAGAGADAGTADSVAGAGAS